MSLLSARLLTIVVSCLEKMPLEISEQAAILERVGITCWDELDSG
jgi:hypothetical protein